MEHEVIVYCDGSYKAGRMGWAIFCMQNGKQIYSTYNGCFDLSYNSIIAELQGAILALKWINEAKKTEFILRTDHLGVFNILTAHSGYSDKRLKSLQDILVDLQNKCTLNNKTIQAEFIQGSRNKADTLSKRWSKNCKSIIK